MTIQSLPFSKDKLPQLLKGNEVLIQFIPLCLVLELDPLIEIERIVPDEVVKFHEESESPANGYGKLYLSEKYVYGWLMNVRPFKNASVGVPKEYRAFWELCNLHIYQFFNGTFSIEELIQEHNGYRELCHHILYDHFHKSQSPNFFKLPF